MFNLKNKDTSPIQSGLTGATVAGANLATSNHFASNTTEMLAIAPSLKSLVRYYLTKSDNGTISLHAMTPYQRIGLRINNTNQKPSLQRTTLFVATSCNKNEYNTKDNDIHVISESNLAMTEVTMENGTPYNGVVVTGSPTVAYIPYNFEFWNQELKGSTIGNIANNLTINSFFKIKKLVNDAADPDAEVDHEENLQAIEKEWNTYLINEQKLVEKGYLVESSIIYAKSSSIAPVISCFQHTRSTSNKLLDANHLYGSVEAGASFAPTISHFTGFGVVSAKEADEISGHKYGQFDVTSTKDNIIVVPESEKANTLESTTRELIVHDTIGNASPVQMTVNDIRRGDTVIKRSQNLTDLAVGTPVKLQGKLTLRVKKAGCLAVNFRISDLEWTTDSRSNNGVEVNSSVMTTIDEDMLLSFEEDLDSLSPTVAAAPSVSAVEPETKDSEEEALELQGEQTGNNFDKF